MSERNEELGPSAPVLRQALARLRGVRVLLVGDLILDRFSEGRVERISREAPVPVFAARRESASLGGAGLVASNLAGLGAVPLVCGLLGTDEAGESAAALLAGCGEATGLVRSKAWQTPVKHRFVVEGRQVFRSDAGSVLADAAPDAVSARRAVHERAARLCSEAQALVLSDYGYGLLRAPETAELIACACAAGLPVVVDPRGTDWEAYRGAGYATPNLQELREVSSLPCEGDAGVVQAAHAVRKRFGIDSILVTRSEAGMTLVSEAEVCHFSVEARLVRDVTGAGDTVVATVAAGLAGGLPLAEAIALANLAAGLVVERPGPVPISAEALAGVLRTGRSGGSAKCVSAAAAAAQATAWRGESLRIGFTNGCFDLLHAGHLAALDEARRHCDRLIVGLNSDASVRALKGEERPFVAAEERAALLAGLSVVDLVVVFDEPTPAELIAIVAPDVLVKGGDYTTENLPGADTVRARGGEVILTPLVAGVSTTALAARIRAAKSASP